MQQDDITTQATALESVNVPLRTHNIPAPEATSRNERSQLERDLSQGHNIRRFAAYGALIFAFVLYSFGVYVVLTVVELVGKASAFAPDLPHITAIVVLALFSVPTILVISVLRAISRADQQKYTSAASLHEWAGKTAVNAVERLVNKI